MDQAEIYKQTFHLLARMTPSLLQKDGEENDTSESELCHMKNLLIKAILSRLKENVRDSLLSTSVMDVELVMQVRNNNDICLWTTPVGMNPKITTTTIPV